MSEVFDSLAAFAGETIVAREVQYKGRTQTLHFRELSADEAEKLFDIFDDNGKVVKARVKGMRNRIIAAVVTNADGSSRGTEQEAGKLPAKVANLLQNIALEVNGIGEKKDSPSESEHGTA